MKHPIIDSWDLLDNFGGMQLIGYISGHPKPDVNHDGVSKSMTSNIVGRRKGRIVTVSGTEYRLGISNSITNLKVVRDLPEV